MPIRDMEMLGIGSPNDVGGTETAGTVMAKENAILGMLNGYQSKVKNNMVLKQTETRVIKNPGSAGLIDVTFDFKKPVRIIGIVLTTKWNSQLTIPVYIINGEESFRCGLRTQNTGIFLLVRDGNGLTFWPLWNDTYINHHISDIWATKLNIQGPGGVLAAGSDLSAYVIYQEEG